MQARRNGGIKEALVRRLGWNLLARRQVASGAAIRSTTIGAEPRVLDFLLRFSRLDRIGERVP